MELNLVNDDGNVIANWELNTDLDIPDAEEISEEIPKEWHDALGTPEQQAARKKRRSEI